MIHPSISVPPVWPILLGLPLLSVAASGEEVSRTPPDQWEWVAEMLIPVEEWQKFPPVPRNPAADEPSEEWAVRSRFVRVEEDGRELRVTHRVAKLLNESGKERLSSDVIYFQPERERVHVVTARTILPGGEIVPVETQGIFIEQSEGDDSSALYSDRRKVKIVFPKIVEGGWVETVFAIEETEARIPGHWSIGTYWNWLEPIRHRELLIDLPASMADSLVWEARGLVLPEPDRQESPEDGRVRFLWSQDRIAPIKYEVAMPNLRQRGPFVQLGNDSNWDRFGNWFQGLVQVANAGASDLAPVARKWTESDANADSEPREIAATLFREVSREIRYTGLEFGDGAFQPRDPNEVLRTRYGDCKDKSNLLRELLRHHGINSRIALLNTNYPGTISKTIATIGAFDHAILAVDLPGKKDPVFCDPTGDGLSFGVLTAMASGRDALLIDDTGAVEWSRTPEFTPEVFRMISDFDLEPNGGFSGWIEVSQTGASGQLTDRRYSKMDRSARIKDGLNYFFNFLEGIIVVDAEDLNTAENQDAPDSGTGASFRYRFYVLKKEPASELGGKTHRFSFPAHRSIVTPVGSSRDTAKRVSPFIMAPSKSFNEVTVRLPRDWEVLETPDEQNFDQDGYQATYSWSVDGRKLTGRASQERTKGEYSVREFRGLAEATNAIVQWLQIPVLLKVSDGKKRKKSAADDWTADPEKLPRMPTVDGFTALIQERFPFDIHNPYDADHDAREKAFARMAKLYPDDDLAQFGSRSMGIVSRMFSFETEPAELVEETRSLFEEYEGKVPEERMAGLELIMAGALLNNDDREAARELAGDLLERKGAAPVIRQSAAAILAPLVSEEDPVRGRELAALALQNSYLPDDEWVAIAGLSMDCFARLPGHGPNKIHGEFSRLIDQWADRAELLKSTFLEGPDLLFDYGYQDEARAYIAALEKLAETHPWQEDAEEEWESAWENFTMFEAIAPHHRRLAEYLAKHPWPDFEKVEDGDFVESASEAWYANSDKPWDVEFRYMLRGLAGFGPQLSFTDDLEEVATIAESWIADHRDSPEKIPKPPELIEALIDELIAVWKESPDGDYTTAVGADIHRGLVIQRRSGIPAAIEYFERMANDESGGVEERIRAISSLKALRGRQKDLPGFLAALRMYQKSDEDPDEDDYLFLNSRIQGAYINLAEGEPEEAWPWFEEFVAAAEAEDSRLKRVKTLLEDREAAKQWWADSAVWWPIWKSLAKQLKVPTSENEEWVYYSPWESAEDELEYLKKIKNEGKRRKALRDSLQEALEFARWHREGVDDAIALLEQQALPLFPQSEAEIQEFTKRLQR